MRKKVACSGYRNEAEFRFQVESTTSFSANLGKDRRKLSLIGKEASARPFTLVEASRQKVDPGRRVREQQYVRLPAHNPLIQSWDVQAVPFFMQIVRPASDLARGIFDVVPHILSREGQHSAVHHSCYAVASACLAHKNRSTAAKLLQTKAHSNAIRAVSRALDDSSHFKTDGTMLAIWFLGYYEVCTFYLIESSWMLTYTSFYSA